MSTLADALKATADKRGSSEVLKQYRHVMEMITSSEAMNRQWNNYRKDFAYASEIELSDTCECVVRIMAEIARAD